MNLGSEPHTPRAGDALSAAHCSNVVLVGFMGSGKSSVGRLIARALGGRFVDTDALVVEETRCDIADIFARDGEPAFRIAETRALQSLAGRRGLIVATGGGILTVPANLPLLKALGPVVWLDAREEIIWARVSRNRARPLLHTEDPRQTVHDLLAARNPLYAAAADLRVDTSDLTHEQTARQVCESLPARL